jgi:hypothetical protein
LEVVCGGVNLLPDEPPPIGGRFCRVVEVDLLTPDDDELPPEDWLPAAGAEIGACCCATGAGA